MGLGRAVRLALTALLFLFQDLPGIGSQRREGQREPGLLPLAPGTLLAVDACGGAERTCGEARAERRGAAPLGGLRVSTGAPVPG